MSGITDQSATTHGTSEPVDKGKGKAAVPAEETEGESSDEETVDPDAVCPPVLLYSPLFCYAWASSYVVMSSN